MYQHLTECETHAENMQISFCFCKTCICLKHLENVQISVNMIDRLDITDGECSVKCGFILNTVIFIAAALNISLRNYINVMVNDFIYLAKGFRMKPKERSTLNIYICVLEMIGSSPIYDDDVETFGGKWPRNWSQKTSWRHARESSYTPSV